MIIKVFYSANVLVFEHLPLENVTSLFKISSTLAVDFVQNLSGININ
ncbi:hypothetical protein [Mammaliicoccus lentus]